MAKHSVVDWGHNIPCKRELHQRYHYFNKQLYSIEVRPQGCTGCDLTGEPMLAFL